MKRREGIDKISGNTANWDDLATVPRSMVYGDPSSFEA